ncbi:MAG: hypothetical protein VYB54_14770 [Pseudomonadota bacterium]|nr:hypothetical protein [Pseudomonadota bacterium]
MTTDLNAVAGAAAAKATDGDSTAGRAVWHVPLVCELSISLDTWEGGVGTADGGTAITPG